MYRALRYIGPVGLGATSPQLFKAEDNEGQVKVCVVKLAVNRLGSKVLVNELLASRFGEWLNLCFPPGGVIDIPEDIIKRSRRLSRAGVQAGLHFGCEYLNGAGYVTKFNLHRAVNKKQMAGVMLFDHLFHNPDRTDNRNNLLMRREPSGYKIYAIDNSHLFRRGKWSIEMLRELAEEVIVNKRRSYGRLLKYYLEPEDLFSYARAVKKLSDGQISSLLEEMPEEWLPDKAERQALLDYIIIRRDQVNGVAARVAELIPNVNRSTDISQGK